MKPNAPAACCIWEYVDWRPFAKIKYDDPSMRRHNSKAANRRTYTMLLAESVSSLELGGALLGNGSMRLTVQWR